MGENTEVFAEDSPYFPHMLVGGSSVVLLAGHWD
jgi:hypothetical protein